MALKLLKVLLYVTLIVGLTTQPAAASSKTVKIKVTLVSVNLIENNHVGNDWITNGYVNGKEILEGATTELNVKTTDNLKLAVQAEEQDKIPDIGDESATIKVSSITKKIKKSFNVTVIENRGRYSGNTAQWQFVFIIQKR